MSIFGKRDKTRAHRYYEEQLSAYLDGELPAREQRLVEEHLKSCSSCRWELATLRQTVRWTAELPTVPVPRAFTIPASAVEPAPTRRRWLPFGGERPRSVPALQVATVLVACLLVFAAAGDVMLTGWPWGGAAEAPLMLQETVPAALPAEGTELQGAEVEEELAAGEEVAAVTSAPYGGGTEPARPAVEAPAEEALESPLPAVGEAVPEAEADASRAVTGTATPAPAVATNLEPTAVIAPTPTAVIAPTPTALPTVHPRTTKALPPPTAVVQVAEPVPPPDTAGGTALGLDPGEQEGALFWLRLIEYVLGVALLLLVTTVLVLRVWRRRTS